MNLVEDYFSKKYFPEEIFSGSFENFETNGQILFFDRVFRRHHTFSDPINFIDQNGLWGIQIGSGGGLDFLFGGGSADSGIAITYSKKSGLQIGFYGTKTVKTGYGVSGGLGVSASVTPGAQCLQDLEGNATGAGVDSAISGSLFRSTTPDGRQLNTYGISVGKGTGLFPYGGISSTRIVH